MLSISLCAAAVFQGLDDTTSLWGAEEGRMSRDGRDHFPSLQRGIGSVRRSSPLSGDWGFGFYLEPRRRLA
jgi:hypothetical protein